MFAGVIVRYVLSDENVTHCDVEGTFGAGYFSRYFRTLFRSLCKDHGQICLKLTDTSFPVTPLSAIFGAEGRSAVFMEIRLIKKYIKQT